MEEGTEATTSAEQRRARVARAVDEWIKQLIDLTGRNQLLYYRTLKRGTLELTEASPEPLAELLSGRKVRLSQLMSSTLDAPDRKVDAVRRARVIHGKALTYFEERGIETLFLAVGMATWTTSSSQSTPNAPVLLRPLKLDRRGAAEDDFDVALHGDWDVNDALVHLLATEYRLEIGITELLGLLNSVENLGAFDPARLFERLKAQAREVPDFRIDRRHVVGTFAYTKLPMVADLRDHVEELAAHDLISAVAGDEGAQATIREQRARDVDASQPDRTPPADEFLILDADASQNLAINAALSGDPLIVQGPPGTGKSQTIANLIATMTARGRRVLFVAEKRAAIDAVTKRLDQVGLGELVMDLHGGVTSKKQLASDIAHTLDGIAQLPRVDVTELHHILQTSRSALKDYVDALHQTREPWQLSVYEVNERLLGLDSQGVTDLRFAGARLESLSSEVARQARTNLDEWVQLAEPIITNRSPWAGAIVASDHDARAALDLVDNLAHQAVPDTRDHLDQVLQQTGLPTPASVADWERTLALLDALAGTATLLEHEVFDLDLGETLKLLAPGGRNGWSRMVAQLFDGRYRAAKQQIRSLWRGGGKPGGTELFAAITRAREQLVEWQTLGGQGRPQLPEQLPAAAGSYQQLTSRLAGLAAYLVTRDLAATSHRDLDTQVTGLLRDQQTLFRLPRIHELESWVSDHHLCPLLDGVRNGHIEPREIVAAFDLAWLHSIRTHVISRDRRLASFDGQLQQQRVETFCTADRTHLDSTAARVRRAVAEQATAVANQRPDQDRLVRKEANKKSRHLPLRALFDEAPDMLLALRPCWTMSPLVVAQTLPARPIFDLVVFDEASQVLPADAIPALLRAPQAVVAGDRRQLPPTTFFDASVDGDEPDEEEDTAALTTGFESILDVLDTLLGNRMLTWHYRSEDERLIAFSNHNIYDSSLTTFPGVAAGECLAHELIPHRPGVRIDTRSNDFEVERVVELMLEHAERRPEESLGVIAMGQHHASRIEAALRDRLSQRYNAQLEAFFDEARKERAFVKNLERVQGDERDAIILTVGYSKQPDGRLLYRFGPLNGQGGERRLNVAVSRARRRLTLVSSFSHTDMDPSRSSSRGVDLLRRYLKYTESGGADLDWAEENTPLNPFEIDIKHRLERAGLTVIPQYGVSRFRIDFAVPHPTQPGRMALAVEADGASYHSSQTARDRDRLRQQMLERLGWRFHRIWSTDWFNDPEAETRRTVTAYEQAIAAIDSGQRRATVDPDHGFGDAGWEYETATRVGHRPHVAHQDRDPQSLIRLATWIESDGLLRTEEQVLDLMMDELGFRRRGHLVVAAITDAIRAARSRRPEP